MADTMTECANQAVTFDAVESLVLWSNPYTDVEAFRDDTDPWPLFVLVVDGDVDHGPAALTELLDRPRSPLETVTHSSCTWSVDDPRRALLRLAVLVRRPVKLALDLAVPAQCFLGLSDIVAAGATLGVTTRRHARRITARVDHGQALEDVVLLGSRTSSELGLLADRLCRNEKRV